MAYSLSGSLSKRKGKANVSPMVRRHSEDVLSRCEEGDLLEFPRDGYSHWAVYVGGEKVIHLAGNSDALSAGIRSSAEQAASFSTIFGVMSDAGKIMEDSFWDVVGDSIVKINNYKDTSKCVQSGRAILERARSRLGKVGYNALWNNCEHFATWCRYGEGDSKQAATAITAGLCVGAVVAGLGALWLSSGTGKKEKRGK